MMINISNVTFRYSKKSEIFNDLNLTLQAGSIVGLLGKNGAGKTSLLKLIGGLRFANGGTVAVNTHNPAKRQVSFLEELYFLPEEFDTPTCSCSEFVKVYAPFYKNFNTTLFKNLCDGFEVDLLQKLQRLSYGQKKKFLISFALATQCKLLILDEPTNGLDIPSKAVFRKVLAGALSDNQLVIISTHQVRDVENLIDRIVVLDNGQIAYNSDIFSISNKFAFTEMPCLTDGCVYHEPSPGGFRMIERADNAGTAIDMELLFNAVINHKLN
jgi:ABC-2 type transport system ATP-binding protein